MKNISSIVKITPSFLSRYNKESKFWFMGCPIIRFGPQLNLKSTYLNPENYETIKIVFPYVIGRGHS
jgi:hypothetical protein